MLNLRCIEASELWGVVTEQHRVVSLAKVGKHRKNYCDEVSERRMGFDKRLFSRERLGCLNKSPDIEGDLGMRLLTIRPFNC